jgi:hypothetical protein
LTLAVRYEGCMQKGTLLIFAALPLILGGVVLLKVTGLTFWWAAVALGAAIGTTGGIQVSQNVK